MKQSDHIQRLQTSRAPAALQAEPLSLSAAGEGQFSRHDEIQSMVDKSPRQSAQRRLISSLPPLQRQVVDNGGTAINNRNVAVAWKGGGAYADTPSIFNTREIPPTTNKAGMILEPRLAEVGNVWRTLPATQNVGWRMELPTAGPWIHPSQAKLEELDAFAQGGGWNAPERDETEKDIPFTLRVEGVPSSVALMQSILAHEMQHTVEQNEIVGDILEPWDQDVAANTAAGPDPLSAGLAYDALHIQPAQDVADDIVNELIRKGQAFHGTPEGQEPEIAHAGADFSTQVYTVRLKGRS
jgi:hypothetical protein